MARSQDDERRRRDREPPAGRPLTENEKAAHRSVHANDELGIPRPPGEESTEPVERRRHEIDEEGAGQP